MQIARGHFKYFQVQTHVQTARESPDLNMDCRSFDNGLKQLYDWIYARMIKLSYDVASESETTLCI